MDVEKIMDEHFKSVSYDKADDWRKTPETDEDPEEMMSSPQMSMFDDVPGDEGSDGDSESGGQNDAANDQGDEVPGGGSLRPRLSIDEVKNLWDGSKQTRDRLVDIIAQNHGDHIHFPTDIKWDGLSRHMRLMVVHALSDLGHDFEHIDKLPKLAKRQGGLPEVQDKDQNDQEAESNDDLE